MIHVLNSTVMPTVGCYNLMGITEGGFMRAIKTAYRSGNLTSWIGYQQNADYIRKHTGITLPLSRQETKIKEGDKLLIMKLRYRVEGLPKGSPVDENDFEFFECEFSATTETR